MIYILYSIISKKTTITIPFSNHPQHHHNTRKTTTIPAFSQGKNRRFRERPGIMDGSQKPDYAARHLGTCGDGTRMVMEPRIKVR